MIPGFNRINVVFTKELVDNLRDRRSILSALLSTLIGPIITIGMVVLIGKTIFSEINDMDMLLPVLGLENAPTLISHLEQSGIHAVSAPENYMEAVKNGELDVVLVIPEEFAEEFTTGQPATIEFIFDSTRQSSVPAIETVRNALSSYSQQIGNLRLMARGISPVVIEPLLIDNIDLATPETQSLIFLNMMPYFIVLVIFVGGMYVVIDTTAGERERSSLEPLLINPLPRWQFVIGKLLASYPFAISAVLINLLFFAAAFNLFPLEDYVGFQMSIDPQAILGIFLISIPMVILASALQMIIASFTRSFKEAQTYVGILPLVPALPGIGLAFLPVKATVWTMLIPTFGQQLLINQMMRGEQVDPQNILISTISTLVISLLLTYMAILLYQKERIAIGVR